MHYVSGDFNGDGLTDVLALGKPYTYQYSYIGYKYYNSYNYFDNYYRGSGSCYTRTYTRKYKNAYFIDLKREASSVGNYAGSLRQEIKTSGA